MSQLSSTTSFRQSSYDVIRFVAILVVFSIHCMAVLDAQRDTSISIFVSNLFHAFQGIGVPLFVLLSGALLLGKQESPKVYLKRRMVRVLIPFLTWSIILFGIYYIVEPTYYGNDLRNTPPHTVVMKFLNILLFKGIHGVYWYVYMILGLYLIVPVLQNFLRYANENQILYACLLVSAIVVMNMLLPDLLVTKRMISGNLIFLGYFLMGYYIKQYLLQKTWSSSVLMASSLFLLILSFINQYLLIMDQGIIIYFMSISIFGTFMKFEIKNRSAIRYITFVSRTSYGMYLSHVLLISMFVRLGLDEQMPIALVPIVMVFLILLIESVMMYVIEKCKLSKYLGG